VPFLRLTRDQRGYENTFLLHSATPGDRPRVLYWYRSAPGVRVGRPPLDEDAIRTIEEQHPEIDFDWPHILEVGATIEPHVERRSTRPRRTLAKPRGEAPPEAVAAADTSGEPEMTPTVEAPAPAHDLLEELVGREIATRLHARYAEIIARIHERAADEVTRERLETRAASLNPDNWVTPEEILRGVEHADRLFDELRRDIPPPKGPSHTTVVN